METKDKKEVVNYYTIETQDSNSRIPEDNYEDWDEISSSKSLMSNKKVLPAVLSIEGPNVKFSRTVFPVSRDLQDHDTIGYELLINKTWNQHDYVIQIAEEFGFEFMDEEAYDGIVYSYYFKFI